MGFESPGDGGRCFAWVALVDGIDQGFGLLAVVNLTAGQAQADRAACGPARRA
jgi:hypothetical protein